MIHFCRKESVIEDDYDEDGLSDEEAGKLGGWRMMRGKGAVSVGGREKYCHSPYWTIFLRLLQPSHIPQKTYCKRKPVPRGDSPLTGQLSSKISHTMYNIEYDCLCLRRKKTAMSLRHALQKENWEFSKIATEKIEIKFLESELPI